MIEKEYKILLQEKEFLKIKKEFNFTSYCIQKNYYYDTINFELLKNEITFRIRAINKNKFLQIKIPKDINRNFSEKYEYNYKIDNIPLFFTSKEINQNYNFKINKNLKKIGFLITKRSLYKFDDDIYIFLDENFYNNNKDYELEIEFKKNSSIEKIENFLYSLNIINNKAQGKYKRFHNSKLKNLNI